MALPIVFLSNFKGWQYGLLGAGSLAIAALLLVGARSPRLSEPVRAVVPSAVTIAVLAAALYALFLREPVDMVLAPRDAYSLRTFASFYVTLPGLLAALLGYALFARRLFWKAPELFMTVAFFSFFFFYKIRIVSDHFWMARRFLPVILPGALLFATAAALGGSRGGWAPTRLLRRAIGLAFVAVLAVQFARAARPVMPHVEYAGIIPKLEEIAGRVGDRDLLIVETRLQSDTHVLALPLAYIYARNVLVLPHRLPDPIQLAAFLDWARTKYDQIYFIGGGGTALLSRHVAVTPVGTEIFQIPEWASSRTALPSEARRKEFDFSVYRFVEPAQQATTAPSDVVLDIGVNDDVNVLRFHAKERHQNGTTFRWSRDVSYISLPGVQAGDRSLVLVMDDGHRPPKVAGAVVEVSMNDRALGRLQVGRDFHTYTLAIPPDVASAAAAAETPPRLKLVTNTWNPKAALGVNDDRDLGVMVDRVEVR
jgi:hypothetical protein